MKKRYKLLRPDFTSHDNCKWEIGVWKETSGKGELCVPGWLHCYVHPLLAVLHNPIHANYNLAIMVEVEVRGTCKMDGQIKEGWTEMRVKREIEAPVITTEQRIKYGIHCALAGYKNADFKKWADSWISGADRTSSAAYAAARAADAAAYAARAAAYAAHAAADAADAAYVSAHAAHAAYAAAHAADAARVSAYAAHAAHADRAADAAAYAARAAAYAANTNINLITCAKKAIGE